MKNEYLIKYLEQALPPSETRDVEKWILLSQDNTKRFNILKAEYIVNSMKETETSVDVNEKYESFKQKNIDRKIQLKVLYKYAAAIVILIATTIFLYNSGDEEVVIPHDAITLELEDGTIKILNQENTSSAKNNTGEIIYQQKGNQLIYSQENTGTKLVFNTLSIPNGKTFELSLSDGTKAHLNAGSTIKYPINFISGKSREIFITGEAYLNVAKREEQSFVVNANDLKIRVLGTQFNVHAYAEDSVTEVVLVEGSVGLYQATKQFDQKNSTLLEPGHIASYGRDTKNIEIRAVNTSIYTSWRSGELVFRDMTFDNILKKMERYYNLTIVNNNSKLSKTIFNASFGIVPVEKVLQELEEVYGIEYTILDNTVTIN